MRWEGHVACKGTKGTVHTGLVRKECHLEEVCVDERVILECILKISVGRVLTGMVWFRIWKMGGCCEHGNDPSCCSE